MDFLSRFWLISSKLLLNKISFVSLAVLSCNKPLSGPTSTEIYFILRKSLLAPIKISDKYIYNFGLNDIPVSGSSEEVLDYHNLNAKFLAEKILQKLQK